MIIGESAGGNLAAAVTLKLRDTKFTPMPKLQLLLFPALQAMDFNMPSYQQNQFDSLLPKEVMIGYWLLYMYGRLEPHLVDAMMANNHTSSQAKKFYSTYLKHKKLYHHPEYVPNNNDYGEEKIWLEMKKILLNPYFSPLMASDLKQLPHAYVMTMGHDILRDEGILYARRLKDAGNKVSYVHHRYATHAIPTLYIQIEDAKPIMKQMHSFITKEL